MKHIQDAIAEDFAAVDRLIVDSLHSDVELVESIGQYIVEGGGKRLRPLITLLVAKALGYGGRKHIELATIIEFLHTATLLHDDVVDVSSLRRGRATANARWGNASSILVGDFIYSRAFQMMVRIGSMRIMEILSDTSNIIAAGEVEQLARAGDPDTTEAQYLQVITRKTAVLFAAAARGGAVLAGADRAAEEAMHHFGLDLGIAFQLVDDVLDYAGDPELTGKNIGDDLAEGKMTLPLIHTVAHGAIADAELVRSAIQNRQRDAIDDVLAAVHRAGGLDHTRQHADRYRLQAVRQLDGLPPTPYFNNLLDIAEIAVARAA